MMIPTGITFRNLRPDEIQIPIEWARQEGWNPGVHDAACHYGVDPAGWFCADLDGEVIGVVVGTNYSPSFSFWGFYIIKPEYRNRGIGWNLYQHMSQHMGSRNFGMDGVYAMKDKYAANLGAIFAYRNIRWQGIADGKESPALIPAAKVPFGTLLAYDSAHFPVPRHSFLEKWIRQPEGTSLVRTGPDNTIQGYGVIRRCFQGHKIGPIFADTPEIADELLNGLMATVPGEIIFFDTPELNTAAVRMARDRKMTEVFGTARMYSKEIPPLPIQEIFGVTTFELG